MYYECDIKGTQICLPQLKPFSGKMEIVMWSGNVNASSSD